MRSAINSRAHSELSRTLTLDEGASGRHQGQDKMSAEDDAIATLGAYGLESALEGLDADAVSGLRSQLGFRSDIGYAKDDLYNGKFADDLDDDASDPFGRGSFRGSTSGQGRDWEDEADREVRMEMERERQGLVKGGVPTGRVRGEVDDYDDDDEDDEAGPNGRTVAGQSPQAFRVKPEPEDEDMRDYYDQDDQTPSPEPSEMEEMDVYDIFPTFRPGQVLAFTDLFAGLPRKRRKLGGQHVQISYPPILPRLPSTVSYLNGQRTLPPSAANRRPLRHDRLPKMLEEARAQLRAQDPDDPASREAPISSTSAELARLASESAVPIAMPQEERDWVELAMGDWESDIVWSPTSLANRPLPSAAAKPIPTATRLARPRNPAIEQGVWEESIIWDAGRKKWKDFTGLALTEDDPELLLQLRPVEEELEHDAERPGHDRHQTHKRSKIDGGGVDPFNLSNDRVYEASHGVGRRRIRQTFGNLDVQHAYPARKLQLPFYKTRLTKSDARAWHRPALQFPPNLPITFSKVKGAKKKKDKLGRKIRNTADATEILKTTGDMTLKDTSSFFLMEYSEEAPPIIPNYGMGSIIVNYYRKKDAKDPTVPDKSIGEPFLLDPNDDSPFMKFGSIKPGQTVPALYNNLVRAPIFRHKPETTDFLIIKATVENDVNYYIRPIENLYVVGQTYPIVEVPGPHSRKVTSQIKNRLQWIAYRLCEKTPKNRIKITRLMKYFNDQTELQMRQRLKDFMEYNRKGPNQGFWMIRSTITIPDKEEIFKLVTPEGICLTESMQVGQRHLLDAGYGKDADAENEGDDEGSKLDVEQQLAPWSTTKNFLHANQNKAMLQLHGEGDPSGRGEAFSFIRVSMKEIFLREGETMEERNAEIASRPKSSHRYNVQEQQEIYREEIERIWTAQLKALSNPVPPELTMEDELRARAKSRGFSMVPDTPFSGGAPTPQDWSRRGSRSPSAMSRQSSPDKEDAMSVTSRNLGIGANKAVKIRRLVNGKWQKEIVRDPAVVNAYLRQRRLIEEQEPLTGDLAPTDDPELNARRKKAIEEQIAKLQKNQERRLARKGGKIGKDGTGLLLKKGPKQDTTRTCSNCGQKGHMRTNRKCPRWAEFNLPGGAAAPPGGSTPFEGPSEGMPGMAIAGFGPVLQQPGTPHVDTEVEQA